MPTSEKSLVCPLALLIFSYYSEASPTYSCANHAFVTIASLSLNCPNLSGRSLITTTAFCTVDLVASLLLFFNLAALTCLVHDMPNSEVAGFVTVALRSSEKYETSSIVLHRS